MTSSTAWLASGPSGWRRSGAWLEAVRPWPPRGGCPGKKGEIWQRNRRDRWHRRFTSGGEHWAWCWHRSARRRRLRTSPRSVFWSSRLKSRGSRMSGSLPSRRRGEKGFKLIKIGVPGGSEVLTAIDNLGAQQAQGFIICVPDVKLGSAVVAKAKQNRLKLMTVDDRLVDGAG